MSESGVWMALADTMIGTIRVWFKHILLKTVCAVVVPIRFEVSCVG